MAINFKSIIIGTIVIAALLSSCSHNSDNSDVSMAKMPNDSLAFDTLMVGQLAFVIAESSLDEYTEAKVAFMQDHEEMYEIASIENVKEVGSKLVFTLQNGKKTELVSNTGGENTAVYTMAQKPTIDNYWFVKVQLYEGQEVLLVNKTDGSQISMAQFPFHLKDDVYVSLNADLMAGYSFNGIECFKMNALNTLNSIGKRETGYWGPNDYVVDEEGNLFIHKKSWNEDFTALEESFIKLILIGADLALR